MMNNRTQSGSKYPDSCFLSKETNKRNQGSPDYWGRLTLSEDMIRYLAGQLKAGEEPIVRVALWRKENDRGVYLSMQLSVPQQGQQRGGGGGGQPRQTTGRAQPRQLPPERRDDLNDDLNDEIPF